MLNLPNIITVARLFMAPVFVWLLWQQRYGLALAVFLAAGLSDAVDGYLARHFNQVTRFGATLDPVADKLIILAALIVLTLLERMPLWLALAMAARDLVIVSGAIAYRLRAGSLEMAPTYLGKLHTFLAFVVICLVMGDGAGVLEASGWLHWLFDALLLTTLVSGAQYVWVWGNKARELPRQETG